MENTVHSADAAGGKPAKRRGFISLYTKGEEIFNAVSHIAGGGMGVVFLIVGLILSYPNGRGMVGVGVFGTCVVLLYTMSALYHILPNGCAKGVFRIFDHCTIFLLIAGTYTPFCLLGLQGPTGIAMLAAQWGLAVAGITMNAIAMKRKAIKILSMVLYLGMGWLIALGFSDLLSNISTLSFAFLLAGGIAYTAGIVFYAAGRRVKYFHSVWHLFDLLGTALHFVSVLLLPF